MDQWRPLLDLLTSSTSLTPHADASLFLSHQHHLTTSAFLALLLSPTTAGSSFWIQTLPALLQSRILSFLAIEARRFPGEHLRSLARNVLNNGGRGSKLDFWVRRSAIHLLDCVSDEKRLSLSSDWDGVHGLQSLPSSLDCSILLPWLPFSAERLSSVEQPSMVAEAFYHGEKSLCLPDESPPMVTAAVFSEQDSAMDPETQVKAAALKARLAAGDESTATADEIRHLCCSSSDTLALIEPWQASDEFMALLLPQLSTMSAPAQGVAATVLPKLLTLRTPPSRCLLTATIDFCKTHQAAGVEGLLLPLYLNKEGINSRQCDLLTKVIKECLHPVHASAFFQMLLCKGQGRRLTCLPRHKSLLSEELVWTEACFTLLQNMLDNNVFLTPDSVERIVEGIGEMAGLLSKSLKFGNFLLRLIGKYGVASEQHKDLLIAAVEKTETFLTNSILAKLKNL